MDETLKTKVNEHYQLGQGSIQDIARVYRLSVEEVLDIIGQSEVAVVEGMGDLIGPEEAGEAPIVTSKKYQAKFTTD